jgi:uncharacterized protein (TIGR01777 family)
VLTLVRREPRAGEVRWDPGSDLLDAAALDGVQAAVHLAGAGIADKRWTSSYREVVRESRTRSTRLLAHALATVDAKVMLSGSAIGIYGDTADREVDESSAAGTGFLAQVCLDWEAATGPAEDAGLRVCHLRTGIVLDRSGGALAKQLPIYRLGAGGPLAGGRQWQSWITLHDEVAAIRHLLHADVAGAVNLTAPQPVRQRDFAKALAKGLHRPAFALRDRRGHRRSTGAAPGAAGLRLQLRLGHDRAGHRRRAVRLRVADWS